MDELASVLIGVAGSWDLFLGQLGVDSGKRKSIQLSNDNKPDFPERCLLEGFDHWVLSDASPTYERVSRALRGDMLHQDQLAVEVEQFAKRVPTEGPSFSEALRFSLEALKLESQASLKPEQRMAIQAVYEGNDVFGFGKSLYFKTLPFVKLRLVGTEKSSAVLVYK